MHNLGTLLVEASTVTANAGAAGIHHAAGSATVRGSTVAANAGDGIHNDFADLVVEHTTVAGNTAQVTAIGGTTDSPGRHALRARREPRRPAGGHPELDERRAHDAHRRRARTAT